MTFPGGDNYIPHVTTGSGADKVLPEFVGKSNGQILQGAKAWAKRAGGGGQDGSTIIQAMSEKADEILPSLNNGQQFVWVNYCVPAMLQAAGLAVVDPSTYNESEVYNAGIMSHEAAERSLSDSCREVAKAGADAAEEADDGTDTASGAASKGASAVLTAVEILSAFM